MKTKFGKILTLVLIFAMIACLSAGLVGCGKKPNSESEGSSDNPQQSESVQPQFTFEGNYAYGEYKLSFDKNGKFTYSEAGELFEGTYFKDGDVIRLTFTNIDKGTAEISLERDALILTYKGRAVTLYKQIERTVTFMNGEEVYETKTVMNGNMLSKPTDPAKEGFLFLGWYASSSFQGHTFKFDAELVTSDLTLYARFEENLGGTEYTLSFDLGYDGAEIPSVTTSNKKLIKDVATPEREGYTFEGWWVSAYNTQDKLTFRYRAEEETLFDSDTTLFALWTKNGETALTLSVNNGTATWTGVTATATLTVTGPDGKLVDTQNFGATGSNAYTFDFENKAAGEYVFKLECNGQTVTRYYRNKGLARVSNIKIFDDKVLSFTGVENATAYYLTIYCGDEKHKHNPLDLGNAVSYDFSSCPMKEGGIKFVIKAVGDGYMPSEATYVFDRTLGNVNDLAYSDESGELTWDNVANAEKYLVIVNGKEYLVENGNALSLKGLNAGALNVAVKALADGYNASAEATLTVTKNVEASPAGLSVSNGNLTWKESADANGNKATAYKIKINNEEFTAETNSYDLSAYSWVLDTEYSFAVKAVFASGESLWSDELTAGYLKLINVKYYDGVLSWNPVIGAAGYEYKINNGKWTESAANSLNLTLKKPGVNTFAVRFINAENEKSEELTTEVTAYTVRFESNGGTGLSVVYKAKGDSMNLAGTARPGYASDGWYDVLGGAAANGKRYTSERFDGDSDLTLYANWVPYKYQLTLDYGEFGSGEEDTVTVTFGEYISMPVPSSITDTTMQFVGWNSSEDGKGTFYTDSIGNSLLPWRVVGDQTLYAIYGSAFDFVVDADGYSVKASGSLSYYTTNLTIPSEYQGKKVRSIAEYGFKGFPYLVSVTLPDTLESIPTTAFDGAKSLEEFKIASTGVVNPVFYVVEGTLIANIMGETKIWFVPAAKTGTYRVPDGVTQIGGSTFAQSNVSEIIIPASVTSVAASAFKNCPVLTSVVFETAEEGTTEKALTMDVNAFAGTNNVKKLVLPARLAEIKDVQGFLSSFRNLSELKVTGIFENRVYATLDENDGGKNTAGMLTNADKDTLLYCPIGINKDNVENFEVEIPSKITKIAAHAFDADSDSYKGILKTYYNITKITFHANIVSIGEAAFYKAVNLKEAVFKAARMSVGMEISDEAFYDSGLETVVFEENGTWNSGSYTATTSCGVITIGESAFAKTNLKEVNLPNSVRNVGKEAFAYNSALNKIDFARVASDLAFGDYAFRSCSSLINVELTANVGYMAFNSVFYGCNKLKGLKVAKDNPNYTQDAQGVVYNKDITEIAYYPDGYEGEYVMPETLTSLGGAVFKDKESLTAIVISKNIVSIGDSAFEGCINLSKVTFEAGGTDTLTIGARAFYNCESLVSIELPARTVSIGEECFKYYQTNIRRLSYVTLNEGLKTIGDAAFFYTSNLVQINIPSTVEYIGADAFWYSGVSEVTFNVTPSGVEKTPLVMGDGVFYNCNGLYEIALPERLAYVPYQAFYQCKNLEKVVIPTTVTNNGSDGTRAIGKEAFKLCSNLSTVEFTKGGDLPLSFGGLAFEDCTSLKTLSLPKRASSLDSSKYDLFELGGGKYYSVNKNVYAFKNGSYFTYDADTKSVTAVSNLEYIEVEEGGEFSSFDGVLYSGDKKTVVFCPFSRKGEVTIAKEATKFRPAAFYAARFVTKIKFEDSENTSLDAFVFDDVTSTSTSSTEAVFTACSSLTSIELPARLTKIGKNAFYNAKSNYTSYKDENGESVKLCLDSHVISSVTFAKGCKLTSIGEMAFYNSDLVEFVMPEKVTTVGKNAFNGSTNLKRIETSIELTEESFSIIHLSVPAAEMIVPATAKHMMLEDGIIYGKDEQGIRTSILHANSSFVADTYEVPATVKLIGASAFKDVAGIKAITFEKSTEELSLNIEQNAFSGSGITSIELPKRTSELGTSIFNGCENLTSVTFENGYACKTITSSMFAGCTALAEITIPGNVNTIERSAFSGCEKLVTVTFGLASADQPSNITVIEADVFKNCTALENLRYAMKNEVTGEVVYENNALPESLTTLGASNSYHSGPFTNCTSLVELKLPTNVTILSKSLFNGCTKLESVTLPAMLKEIEQDAFKGSAITKLDFSTYEDHALTIYEGAFTNCEKLTALNLKKVGTLYLYKTFEGCSALQSLEFDSAIVLNGKKGSSSTYYYSGFEKSGLKEVTYDNKTVLKSIFEKNTSLRKVTFGASVTTVDESAFEGCSNLETFDMSAVTTLDIKASAFKGTALTSFDFTKVKAFTAKYIFQDCKNLATVNIGNIKSIPDNTFNGAGVASIDLSNVTSIGSNAFKGTKLTSVTLSGKLTKIGSSAFANCESLTSVVYDSTLTIPSNLFAGCVNLREVTLNAKVKEIGSSAFKDCKSLESIDLQNVKTLKGSAFEGCTGLKTVAFANSELTLDTYGSSFKGVNGVTFEVPANSDFYADGGILYKGNTLFLNLDDRADVVIRDGTTSINRNAFRYNTSVKTITIPSSLTSIDGYYTFSDCPNLTTINNLENITEFGKKSESTFAGSLISEITISAAGAKVFRNMKNLATVNINGFNVELQVNAFDGCTNLKTINGLEKVYKIEDFAFKDCVSLENVMLSANLKEMGISVFSGCEGLHEVVFDCDFDIPNRTFTGCESLKSVTIGDNVTAIGTEAFKNCTSLNLINLNNVLSVGSSAFEGCTELKRIIIGNDQIVVDERGSSFKNVRDVEFEVPANGALYADGGILYRDNVLLLNLDSRANVVVKDGTTAIARNAFRYNTDVVSVTLPASLTYIDGYYTFESCTNLKAINLENVKDFGEDCSNTFAKTALTEVSLSATGYGMFYDLETLTTVNLIGDAVVIGERTFYGCVNLATVKGSENITEIGKYAFYNATAVENLVLTTKLEIVESSAFGNWTSGQKLTFVGFKKNRFPVAWNSGWNTSCKAQISFVESL